MKQSVSLYGREFQGRDAASIAAERKAFLARPKAPEQKLWGPDFHLKGA